MQSPRKGSWHFDEEVASRFDHEARTHIPNYELVVQKCVDVALRAFPGQFEKKILDIGCATGYTLERLLTAGFQNVYGVDSSQSMIDRCRVQQRVILSDSLPKEHGPYDLILANWTLHFIPEREQYIADIKEALNENGIVIITDKMSSSALVHEKYHDFKRSMGVSEEEIQRKEASIDGVLTTHPLEWYFSVLQKNNFKNISVIDASYCFATIIAFK